MPNSTHNPSLSSLSHVDTPEREAATDAAQLAALVGVLALLAVALCVGALVFEWAATGLAGLIQDVEHRLAEWAVPR